MKVLVKAPLNPYSGYGNDGIGIVRALMRGGADVYVEPTHVSPPLPKDVATLLTKRLAAPFDLLIHHVDPDQLGVSPEARRAAKVTVGWTMWEYTTLDNAKGRRSMRKRLANYDVVLGYDSVSAGALEPYTLTRGRQGPALGILQGGFWPQQWPQVQRDWTGDRFGFAMVGALNQRKDPFVAIEAFRELKAEYPEEFDGAELHLKTNVPGLHMAMEQWVPKLRVHYDVWPDDVLAEFYAAQHCLLAPSRGEGKNMPALEFMSTGGTVIATNWGGHRQWLSNQYAYPLGYELAPVATSTPNCRNARASKTHLKELMWHVYRNRDEARRKGDLAAQLVPAMCSWPAVVDRLFLKLSELAPSGEHLLNAARQSAETTRPRVHADA